MLVENAWTDFLLVSYACPLLLIRKGLLVSKSRDHHLRHNIVR
jgi:hypothetical protein